MKKILLLFVLFVFATHTVAMGQYLIRTVAGNGTAAFMGDNMPATSSELNFPIGVCQDAAGNAYIADAFNVRVRKIGITGIITTIAGNGGTVNTGDNGPATDAGIGGILGICIDKPGNIYITCGHTVRKIDAGTNIITTIAGTPTGGYSGDNEPATDAQLSMPVGLASDTAENIYIADQHNNVIRKVTKATGIITTIAGTGTAGFDGDNGPATAALLANISAVALDKEGNIYVGDNGRVRKVDVTTGIIKTIAGVGLAGYMGDNGPASDAVMYTPGGMAIDDAGDIFISDQGYSVVRRIDASTGIIKTIAGNGTAGYSGDNGPAAWAQLNLPYGISVNGAGTVMYIGDKGNNRVRKLSDPLAVNDISAAPALTVYPNPSAGKFKIETGSNQPYTIEVYNTVGQEVYRSAFDNTSVETDLTQLPDGMYFLQVQSPSGKATQKIEISK